MKNVYSDAVQRYRLSNILDEKRIFEAKQQKVSVIPKREHEFLEAFREGGEFSIVMAILHLIEKKERFATLLKYQENNESRYAIYYLSDDYREFAADPVADMQNGTLSEYYKIPISEFVQKHGTCIVYHHPSTVNDTFDEYDQYIYKSISGGDVTPSKKKV